VQGGPAGLPQSPNRRTFRPEIRNRPNHVGAPAKGNRVRLAAWGACVRRMTEEAPDPALHYGNLIGAYQEAIRLSDFKANLTVLFVAIMMGPVVASRAKFPHFLSLPFALAPFLVVFFCLLMVVLPRFPRRGRNNFLVVRNPSKADFLYSDHDDEEDVEQLKLRCAVLSGILYRKTFFLQISFVICLASIAFTFVLLSYALI
jgi:hypothetical protein